MAASSVRLQIGATTTLWNFEMQLSNNTRPPRVKSIPPQHVGTAFAFSAGHSFLRKGQSCLMVLRLPPLHLSQHLNFSGGGAGFSWTLLNLLLSLPPVKFIAAASADWDGWERKASTQNNESGKPRKCLTFCCLQYLLLAIIRSRRAFGNRRALKGGCCKNLHSLKDHPAQASDGKQTSGGKLSQCRPQTGEFKPWRVYEEEKKGNREKKR